MHIFFNQTLKSQYPNLENYFIWYDNFVNQYINHNTQAPLEMKIQHTCNVLNHAQVISKEEKLNSKLEHMVHLSALFHDVGRFPQYYKWNSFRDATTENHAKTGVKAILQNKILKNEDKNTYKFVIGAIRLHNMHTVPNNLPSNLFLITNIVRDADKIDILRIVSQELIKPEPSEAVILHASREPEKFNPLVLNMILQNKLPNYSDLQYVNDFIMLLCTWPLSFSFNYGLNYIKKHNYINKLHNCLPKHPELEKFTEYLAKHQII